MVKRLILGFSMLVVSMTSIYATHLRSGEITAERISQTSLRYRFTVVLYRDTESSIDINGVFNTGDGRFIAAGRANLEALSIRGIQETNLGNFTSRVVIQFDYTYVREGNYTVSYTEGNRNQNIINLGGTLSGSFPFHVETILTVSNTIINSTPQLTVPPLDQACLGSRFVHISGAFDPDGDSLAYRIVTPLAGLNNPITSYQPLDHPDISTQKEDQSTPAIFTIDPIRGSLQWDAPQLVGEYSIAFIIEEWRFNEQLGRSELLGYVTRDMQIVVAECSDERPLLEAPADTCIVAGTVLESIVTGTDPNGDQILMEAFGGVFGVSSSPAEYLNFPDINDKQLFRDSPAQSLLRWQTDLSHVQAQPHDVVFKVSDIQLDPSIPTLFDFKTMSIQVIAPAPTGLAGIVSGSDAIDLNWDPYIGASFGPTMKIYRRIGSFDFQPSNCDTGIPDGSGYVLIGEVSSNETSYTDDSGIRPGVNYCYRLVAEFPAPKGGISYASAEFCLSINVDTPIMTNVSVLNTNDTNGETFVRWTSPIGINQILFPGPFTYELFRSNDINGSSGRTFLTSTNDTTYNDTGFDTRNLAHNYYVRFYDADNNLVDSSATASSVWLQGSGEIGSVEINWEANTPWSNRSQRFPYHYIYRNRTDSEADDELSYVLVDSVDVLQDGFEYIDIGSFNSTPLKTDRSYCYYIATSGEYEDTGIELPLINESQINCFTPLENPIPDAPEILIENDSSLIDGPSGNSLVVVEKEECQNSNFQSCSALSLSNTINWIINGSESELVSYNVYFSKTGDPNDYELIANTAVKTFEHQGLREFKGCYKVSAINSRGIEGELSEAICFDNCPYYELPNTFTPNGDDINDTFRAFDLTNTQCSRFVQSVVFMVFDRWGGKTIYESKSTNDEKDVFIDWSGNDKQGKPLPSGTYYFTASVIFNTFDPSRRKQEFKNWVQIIR
ncbi:gliding motility-associated C-terminal domain-containing protein [Roseivirga sp. E12]|uniref:T9SS type B sorting domain-containing protein n=1 Tax=Roseivirga sp. E12 TaxID=2819237 RepID=UPI001ABCD2ED|nr:gliding motility-associated C-terminal domain-containing protein [Roseivirga sp. E12]MBO3698665.1 gliding motility-associated C-terminal domain-containing protein [Roseivirga sp. E12]